MQIDSANSFYHIPVMGREVVEGLAICAGGRYLDATVGGGGHSQLILSAAPNVELIAIDQDQHALQAAQQRLAIYSDRVEFYHLNFAEFQSEQSQFDGIVADLGVSSAQVDQADRGFSFRQTAPLDMRMDQGRSLTAAEIINTWDEAELARIFYTYGEERLSRKLARRIVERRPLQTTTDLAEVIFYAVPSSYRYGRIHPATRIFQALRIAVNGELDVLETFLNAAPTWLKPGGRLVIISFHSLEDRLVKHAFRNSSLLQVITRKPITPNQAEIQENTRSRSAKLRIAERVQIDHQ
ncbi:16S rRNA (cytosine(1402)-N(4))-methyltransferase RsmH [Thermocoleostomius sinensis]|uniref:Ribosomal RNA small subunit methyltransferase H n=1 Tax=Thermocoleostomius sinensis A174 TaxID=2016057 RepID=A0A9E8ZNJ2_9CYAN|nr:16S rRNA (cytosine(1402)-N(4))-methyltransferase RsmH [Thermocoleostomius sinensis]WAL61826.1 16S rRNA (cytosine(1402)-N(4))-methyltransferase RsmH [Thermocoleostomius sinensis A174]